MISLDPSPEQVAVLEAVRRLLVAEFPLARLRGEHDTDPDRARLQTIAELGALGLACPEAVGGSGLGVVDETLVAVEFGRHLVTPQALGAAVGARLALIAGEVGLARAIVEGAQRVCLAVPTRPGPCEIDDTAPVLLLNWQEGARALRWGEDWLALSTVAGLAPALRTGTDGSVMLHQTTLSPAQRDPHAAGATAAPLLQALHLQVSAYLLGIAEAACEMAVAYARLRHQFGQPIGAFQAVKHRCADMALRAQVLRAQVVWAALAAQQGAPDAGFQIDACRLLAARAAFDNAASNVQVHGGMGFSAECDAHLLVLRTHLCDSIGGLPGAVEGRLLTHGVQDPPPKGELACVSP